MTSNPKLGWSAQSPPPDFAARTVTAILRDRNGRHERRGGGRWLLIAAAVAITMAGGALAFTALPRAGWRPALTASNAPPPRPVDEAPRAVQATADPPKEPPTKPPAPPAIAPSRRKETPLTQSSEPDAGRRLILPRCNCQEAICDCLQEH